MVLTYDNWIERISRLSINKLALQHDVACETSHVSVSWQVIVLTFSLFTSSKQSDIIPDYIHHLLNQNINPYVEWLRWQYVKIRCSISLVTLPVQKLTRYTVLMYYLHSMVPKQQKLRTVRRPARLVIPVGRYQLCGPEYLAVGKLEGDPTNYYSCNKHEFVSCDFILLKE